MDYMYKISSTIIIGFLFLLSVSSYADTKTPLRILTWEGYVTPEDLKAVNLLLEEKGYLYEATVIKPYAEGAEQMFDLIRGNGIDISFLTLFFIKMMNEQTSKLLQPINTHSPRLSNYKHLIPSLTHLPMGMSSPSELTQKSMPLYIPWGGGAYGFYIDRNRVKAGDVPKSVKELWLPKWKNKYSLNQSQEFYNIGLAFMGMGKSPFLFHELVLAGKRNEIVKTMSSIGELQQKLNLLYTNAGHFWKASPKFNKDLLIVSSWGPEITRENNAGANWRMIEFDEGHMVWLDTINFIKGLKGKKLEAAEIFANYFIGKEVQSRIARELSMVAASTEVADKPGLGNANTIFNDNMFVPPYDDISYSIMKRMTDAATIESIKN